MCIRDRPGGRRDRQRPAGPRNGPGVCRADQVDVRTVSAMRLDDSTWVPRTAEGTVQEVDSDPWPPVARVAQLARQAGAPVELVRQGAAGRDIVWLTVDPCTC